jgi:multidrug efflux pump subunit AcrA (membrane-fusion protein)
MKRRRRLRRLVPDAELIRRRAAGETLRELASEYDVAHTTLGRYFERPEVRKQLKQASEQLRAAERVVAARRAAERRQQQELRRTARKQAAAERRDRRPPSSTARLGVGVPLFPNTREGQYERLAYYEARKLNHLPHSLLDYHDVIHGRETPAERRAWEGRASGGRL